MNSIYVFHRQLTQQNITLLLDVEITSKKRDGFD